MVFLLRMVAALFAIAALAIVGLSLPWRDWLGPGELAVLPEPYTDFEIVIFDHYFITGFWFAVQLLVYGVSAALILMALARITERLDSIWRNQDQPADGTASASDSPGAATPIWGRLASARTLRVAAVVVVIAWIVFDAVPYSGFRLLTPAVGSQLDPRATYFLAMLAGSAVLNGALALVVLALAAILDRLDHMGAQRGGTGR